MIRYFSLLFYMKNLLCILITFFISGSGIYHIIPQQTTINPPSLHNCISCRGNPCRSYYNSSASGRYTYTTNCCKYCGGCI